MSDYNDNMNALNEDDGMNEFEVNFDIETDEDVTFVMERPKTGIAKVLDDKQKAREKEAAERERERRAQQEARERERREKQEAKEREKQEKKQVRAAKRQERLERSKKPLLVALIVLVLCGAAAFGVKLFHKVEAPMSSTNVCGLNYEEVMEEFSEAGFINVKAMKIEDLVLGWLVNDGAVEKVTIDGNEEFSTGELYNSYAKVRVYYHTFSEDMNTGE